MAASLNCLDCAEPIVLESLPLLGQKILCAHCQAALEVINLEPLELDWAYNDPTINLGLLNPLNKQSWALPLSNDDPVR